MKKKIFLILSIVAILSSCNSIFQLFQPLIGTWENDNGYETLTFNAIGFEIVNTYGGYSYSSGDYRVSGDELTLVFDEGQVVYTYSITNDVLTLTSEYDSLIEINYTRQ